MFFFANQCAFSVDIVLFVFLVLSFLCMRPAATWMKQQKQKDQEKEKEGEGEGEGEGDGFG